MTAVVDYSCSTALFIDPHNLCHAPTYRSTMTPQYIFGMRLAPLIYRLPAEILAQIFEVGTHWSEDQNDAIDFPMLVSAVSKHFRSIAIQTPRLWTTIRFESQRPSWYDPNLNDDYEYTYPRDLLWISRSKACPLNLILTFRDRSWNFSENKHYFRREHMEAILSLLSPHAYRIQRFTLVCDTFSPLHAALQFLSVHGSTMNILRTLELYRCNEFPAEHPAFYPAELADPIPLLGGCLVPNVSHVTLSGVHADWSRSCGPLSNLRTLELAFHSRSVRPSVLEFTQILSASPLLTTLTVTASGPFTPSTGANATCAPFRADGTQRVCLSHLKTLEIGYQHVADVDMLLHLIDTPFVVNLTIADTLRPPEDETDNGSYVLEFLAHPSPRHFPRLEVLCLRAMMAAPQAFATFLGSHPGIHTLKLMNVSKEVLSVISSPSLSPPHQLPCPMLRELSLQFMSGINVGLVARARAAGGMPLDELSIYVWDKTSDEEVSLAKQYSKLVTFFGHEDQDSEEDIMNWEDDDDPYAPGGAFNDPEFDAMFT